MNRRKFVQQIGLVSTGLFLSPSLILARTPPNFQKIVIPSAIQVRHGLLTQTIHNDLAATWWQNIKHNRFLVNGHTPEARDLVSYTFGHQSGIYQLLCKDSHCYLYTPESEQGILLDANRASWKDEYFSFQWVTANNSTEILPNTCLLPLQQETNIELHSIKEGEIAYWSQYHPKIQFKNNSILINKL